MAKAKRVFEIARELGVKSKAILEKCKAEGIDVDNHMKAVSAGLEATIRDWFSEDHTEGGGTAVETTEQVDLSKVKAKPRKRKRAKPVGAEAEGGETTEPTAAADTATAVPTGEQAETAPVAGVQPADHAAQQAEPAAAEPEAAAEAPAAGTEQPQAEDTAAAASAEQQESASAAEQQEQQKAAEPAGPQLDQPQAAKLKGPKVVRVEEPEKDQKRKRRRTTDQPLTDVPGAPKTGGGSPGEPDLLRSTGPARGRGAGGGGEEEVARSPRRRRRRGRRTDSREGGAGGGRREQDLREREERLSHSAGYLRQRRRDMRKRAESGGTAPAQTPAKVGGTVEVTEPITIKDLSAATGIKGADIVKYLFDKGVMVTINHTIDAETAMEVCADYDIELKVKEEKTVEERLVEQLQSRQRTDVRSRPPVVTVLGHVDHGKTSLLDRIRKADVAAGEAGGITQHIGAFRASIAGSDQQEKTVVFLDTPGHQAFTTMRARGANLADLVVLVVAADDGVMPQTIESINHAKAAGLPIVVALNKTDKPEATDENVQKILGQLAEHELNPVEWGGQTEVVRVSAETGQHVEDLIELLDFQAELLELTADYAGAAYGHVIEAELDSGRGPLARVLVQEGQIEVGNFVGAGRGFGRIRSMIDDRGQEVQTAGPTTPVEISGLDQVPDAGDKLYVTDTLDKAEELAKQRREQERRQELATKGKVSLDNVFQQMQQAGVKELRVVLKADVQGSVEVLKKTLEEVGQDHEEVRVRVLHAAVGGVTESDVLLAEASDAVIIGFNVIASPQARSQAERRDVEIRLYRVIYDVTEDVTRALEGLLAPQQREEVLGHAEVREVFRVSKVGAVAGCYVTDGTVRRNALIRVTREDIVVEHDRTLESLKRFQDDVKDVRAGMECGMKIEGYDDIREGDILECYEKREIKPTLSS